jgi:hypothetical protein
MEVGQGPNWGCSAKEEKKIGITKQRHRPHRKHRIQQLHDCCLRTFLSDGSGIVACYTAVVQQWLFLAPHFLL